MTDTSAPERISEILTAHQNRMEYLHLMVLVARDVIRPNLDQDSPDWLRSAFDAMQVVHHGMGGDPLVLHIRAAVEAERDALRAEVERLRVEVETAKAFGLWFYDPAVTERTRENYRALVRAALSETTSTEGDPDA